MPLQEKEAVVGIDSVLLVDDDPGASIIKENLEAYCRELDSEKQRCEVYLVGTLGDAKLLLKKYQYAAIVMDVWFTAEDAYGDVFIVNNQNLLHGAETIVYSAHDDVFFRRHQQLKDMSIEILKKGSPEFFPKLHRFVIEAIGKRRGILPGDWAGRALVDKAQGLVIEWLLAEGDPDAKGIFYGGREYSANMLVDEIKRGTPVGRRHVDMILNEMIDKIKE
jgi:hypothetical protein